MNYYQSIFKVVLFVKYVPTRGLGELDIKKTINKYYSKFYYIASIHRLDDVIYKLVSTKSV